VPSDIWTRGALADVWEERANQERLRSEGRFTHTCADDGISDFERYAILAEEMGEVARACLENAELSNDVHGANLRKELVQVAAVAVAFIENIDKRTAEE